MKTFILTACLMLTFCGPAWALREQIRIVGSSVVEPITAAVGEAFARTTGLAPPATEINGTSAGIEVFCAGVGEGTPDFVNASRRMRKDEFELCAINGVTEIVEINVGLGGVALAQMAGAAEFALTRQQVFLALAREVPGPDGKLVANPYKMWSEIDPALPATAIKVFGPGEGNGTHDGFMRLFMEEGAKKFKLLAELAQSDAAAFAEAARALRRDGAYVTVADYDVIGPRTLLANPDALGIAGFAVLARNSAAVKGLAIDGIAVSARSIADGSYPAAQPLYIYAKKQHLGLVAGMQEFINEHTSEKAIGQSGYLSGKGLVALTDKQKAGMQASVNALKPLESGDFELRVAKKENTRIVAPPPVVIAEAPPAVKPVAAPVKTTVPKPPQRRSIRIVASPLVEPITAAVGKAFAKATKLKPPAVEITGSSAGIALFCAGLGLGTPDFVDTSRRMRKDEFELCAANGVTEIVEINIGLGGVAIAQAAESVEFALTKKQVFLALAREVPGPDGKLVANPYKTWSEIDPALPATAIKVFGPEEGDGNHDGFMRLFMEDGAMTMETLASLARSDAAAFAAAARALRQDGAYVAVAGDDVIGPKTLLANPDAVAITGFAALARNASAVRGLAIDGIAVSHDSITDGAYPAVQPLYIYAKKQHLDLVPGMQEFIKEHTSEKAIGMRGYLSDLGLVGLTGHQKRKARSTADALRPLEGGELG